MKTFGFNLLSIANSVIGFQQVQWFAFKERTENARGHFESEYFDPVTITGSWQPVGETTVQNLGLDVSKKYFNFYTSNPIENVQRGTSPDKIVFEGSTYDVVGESDWYTQNGWRGIMCVYVGAS